MTAAVVLGALDPTSIVVALIAAASSTLSAWFSYRASRRAGHARQASERALGAIGPRDGETISELLWRIAEFEEYQHDRNHDILNVLQAIILRLEIIHGLVGGNIRDLPPELRKGTRPPPIRRRQPPQQDR